MDAQLYFGKVHIVEWLGAADLKTGWALYDELEPAALVFKPSLGVTFTRVQNSQEFKAAVRHIAEDVRSSGKLPLLHIETHGSDQGIGSTSDDGLSWAEVMAELIPLNQITGLRLWVVLAACEGVWGMKMAQPVTRAAFLALLGPNQPISAGKLQAAVLQFYRTLLRDRNGNTAIQAMNEAVAPEPAAFSIVNAEKLFKDVYSAFLRDRCTEPELTRRVEKIASAAAARYKTEHGVDMPAETVRQFRDMARQHVESVDEHFTECRRHFFFADLFPENDQRFPITLEACRSRLTSG